MISSLNGLTLLLMGVIPLLIVAQQSPSSLPSSPLSYPNNGIIPSKAPAAFRPPPLAPKVRPYCSNDYASMTRWSSRWSNNMNGEVVINRGDKILLDVESIQITGGITIADGGVLVVEDGGNKRYTIDTNYIIVFGEFHIGSEACPFSGHIDIQLTDGPTGPHGHHFGQKALGVGQNGVLEFHGNRGHGVNSWTKLSTTVNRGDNMISLINGVEWRVGDVVVVASTDFNMDQAEQVTITRVISSSQYEVTPSFNYMHFGAITYGVDERGEVGLLTRNIIVRGSKHGSFGGHTMIVSGVRALHIEGVEFANMGQANTVGRYPIHFHMCNRVPGGTYVRYSSVHHSNFRCMTIHGTHGVTLQGNVAYDHYGHCIFFEDGVEEDNILDGNLALVTRAKNVAGPGSNEAGVRSDWEAPTTYWITHPNNIVINNVAGGSAHTGIWYLFRQGPSGLSKLSGLYNNKASPTTIPLGTHRNNVVHSCGTAGLFLEPTNHNFALDNDGIQMHDKSPFDAYHPMLNGVPSNTIFEDVTVYKTRIKGAWFRGLSVWFKNCRFADNQAGLTIASAGSHPDGDGGGLTTGAIFVGWSDNKGQDAPGQPPMNSERGATTPQGPGLAIRGYQFYDGPQIIQDSTFARYDSDRYAHHSALALFYQNTWQMAATNGAKRLSFDDTTTRYWVEVAKAPNYVLRLDGDTNAIVADHDGSISGYRQSTIINNYPYFITRGCKVREEWNAAVCPHRYSNVWIENLASNEANYPLKELFKPALYTIRDQHTGSYHDYRQEVLGIPQMDRWGNKFRYQIVASHEASYILDWPFVTPSLIRLQLNNAHISDGLRYGICYPRGTIIRNVIRGLFKNNHDRGSMDMGLPLTSSPSLTSLPFMSGDSYHWDTERSMIFVTLKQRYNRGHDDQYCPNEGCEQLWIDAVIPPNSAPVSCGDIAYPHYRSSTDDPFYDRRLVPGIGNAHANDKESWLLSPSSSDNMSAAAIENNNNPNNEPNDCDGVSPSIATNSVSTSASRLQRMLSMPDNK